MYEEISRGRMFVSDRVGTNRIVWLDYAKGIGIIYVLVAHGLPATNFASIWIYSFHLAEFFCMSGMMIKEETLSKTYIDIIKKYVLSILAPYYLFGTITAIVEILKDFLQHDFNIKTAFEIFLKLLFWGGVKADWFLPCLFLAIIFFTLLSKIMKNKYIVVTVSLIISFGVMQIQSNGWFTSVFLRAFVGMFFVALGYVSKNLYLYPKQSITSKYFKLLLWLVLSTLMTVLAFINGKVSLFAFNFGKYSFCFLVTGVIGMYVTAEISRSLSDYKISILNFCGRNSLLIMVIHMEVLALTGTVLKKIIPQAAEQGTPLFLIMRIVVSFVISLLLVNPAKRLQNLVIKKRK